MIAVSNYIVISTNNNTDKNHLVEIKRLVDDMQSSSTSPNTDKYPHILSVSLYDPDDHTSNPYVVEQVNGELYRIEYTTDSSDNTLIYINISFGIMLIITIVTFILIYIKVMRPFAAMEKMAVDLARGNLTRPLHEEKSKVFGRFLWGLDMLREQLEAGREREKEYQKERKTLMLSLSHDIKTPLSAIELYEKALSSGLYDTPDKQKQAYDGIRKNAEELHRYIDEITAASREDFLAIEVKDGEYYLDEVISEISSYYTERFAGLHTEFSIDSYSNILLKGDKDRLIEVLQNLLENAIKYGDGNEVKISFSEEEDARLIHIESSGAGPKEDEMLHIFDSFYRGSNVGEKKGSGLGLYISRELMKKMDGEIYATSDDGSFTAVVVTRKV
ncbi:MAG: HAMP domain-containing histidine kinase [Eubacterium sp.]|nr:HAMP domain-containing histidine kinase [Eubacterium sp.]